MQYYTCINTFAPNSELDLFQYTTSKLIELLPSFVVNQHWSIPFHDIIKEQEKHIQHQ